MTEISGDAIDVVGSEDLTEDGTGSGVGFTTLPVLCFSDFVDEPYPFGFKAFAFSSNVRVSTPFAWSARGILPAE
jgi:hypothetical protein